MKSSVQRGLPSTAALVVLMVVLICAALNISASETNPVNAPNQFAVYSVYSAEEDASYPTALRILDGGLYACGTDGAWTAIELGGTARQVFSGEEICVLKEDGSCLYLDVADD